MSFVLIAFRGSLPPKTMPRFASPSRISSRSIGRPTSRMRPATASSNTSAGTPGARIAGRRARSCSGVGIASIGITSSAGFMAGLGEEPVRSS